MSGWVKLGWSSIYIDIDVDSDSDIDVDIDTVVAGLSDFY